MTTRFHLSVIQDTACGFDFDHFGGTAQDGAPVRNAYYSSRQPRVLPAGRSCSDTCRQAVSGPQLTAGTGLFREGNEISGTMSLLADRAGHGGSSTYP